MDTEGFKESRGKPRRSSKKRLWPSVPKKKRVYNWRKNIKTNNSPSEGETNNELPKPSTKKTPRVRKEKIKAEPAEELPETSSRYMMRKRTAKKTAEHEEEVASSQHRTSSHTQGDAKKKRKKRLPKAKTIISSVYNYLKTEYETLKSYTGGSCDLSPLDDILKRTAAATGVSEDVVTAVLEGEDSEEEDSLNESSRKRARVSSESNDENESPAEEVSDGEIADEADEAQPGNEESLIEIEEHPIETLKVEIDENDEYHSTPNSGILFHVPLTKEQLSALQASLLPREPTHTKVKLEPADIEEQQYFEGADAVPDTGGEQDPLGDESTTASTTEVQTIRSRKKTNAQRCREYRERKKSQNTMVQNITAERSDGCSETDQLQAKKPKTNAERSKKHYEAQKLKKQKSKKIPETVK